MFRKVIVGVDGGATGRDAVSLARLLVAADGRIALAHVHELTPVRGASGAYGPAETGESMQLLDAERSAAGIDAQLLAITASSVGRGLHYLAQTQNADLLCVGSNPRSFAGRVLMGDVSRAALIGAPCAVAIAPLEFASEHRAIATIGVGYDASRESEAALAFARDLAAHHHAALSAMTVVEPSPYASIARGRVGEQELAEARRELAALDGVQGAVASGLAGEELALFSAGLDILIVGSRGYGPLRSLMLGSTATHLAGSARCPLLVLPRLEEEDGTKAARVGLEEGGGASRADPAA